VLGITYLISWPILFASDRLITLLGESKVSILTRVLGIILAALAVQYVFNGITGYYDALVSR
jgi:multiple antibiotic resistance protein